MKWTTDPLGNQSELAVIMKIWMPNSIQEVSQTLVERKFIGRPLGEFESCNFNRLHSSSLLLNCWTCENENEGFIDFSKLPGSCLEQGMQFFCGKTYRPSLLRWDCYAIKKSIELSTKWWLSDAFCYSRFGQQFDAVNFCCLFVFLLCQWFLFISLSVPIHYF